MNIFITHQSPVEAANYLFKNDPKRAMKMTVESSQILSSAINVIDPVQETPHKSQGNKSPMFWVLQDRNNLDWLHKYTIHLAKLTKVKCRTNTMFNGASLYRIWRNFRINTNGDHHDAVPMCLCERSAYLRGVTGMPVTEVYKVLLMEKWELSNGDK